MCPAGRAPFQNRSSRHKRKHLTGQRERPLPNWPLLGKGRTPLYQNKAHSSKGSRLPTPSTGHLKIQVNSYNSAVQKAAEKTGSTALHEKRETKSAAIAGQMQRTGTKKEAIERSLLFGVGVYLFSRAVASQVFSARVSLTAVFGMGTGGPSPLTTPTIHLIRTLKTEQ